MTNHILGVAPWVVVSALISAVLTYLTIRERRTSAKERQTNKIEIHKDELTFDLLQSAREEMQTARSEVVNLRNEVKHLRAMEDHFYHFEQSLDHLEALLFAKDKDQMAVAQRNAKAFLTRMRKLQAGKGNTDA